MSDLKEIIAEPLSSERFAPFGEIVQSPKQSGRDYFNNGLDNARPHANADLSIAKINPLENLPLIVHTMERHPHSSQTFIPIRAGRYLVIVAPDGDNDRPDLEQVRVFVSDSSVGITYRRGVWHHGMTVLDTPAEMAILMWCDNGQEDEEFIDVESPFSVVVPA